MLRGVQESFLAYTKEGLTSTKAELVNDWQALYGAEVSGHSTRRSGALQYIRKGWAVPQVAYLGRWKSNIVLQYAREALESMALNGKQKFTHPLVDLQADQVEKDTNTLASMLRGNQTPTQSAAEVEEADSKVNSLKEDLAKFKGSTKAAADKLKTAVKTLEQRADSSSKYLPPLVRSGRNQVVHKNTKVLVFAPAYLWRTKCGWGYYSSNYEFVEGEDTMVTCQKCTASA